MHTQMNIFKFSLIFIGFYQKKAKKTKKCLNQYKLIISQINSFLRILETEGSTQRAQIFEIQPFIVVRQVVNLNNIQTLLKNQQEPTMIT
ncbi:unnamed protein product [Paramecium octaurelia]|uniref:Uncharacterized protein n=1 Tax=Paramecium octaurelia TaxID=43137 RepID=A0A8S1UDR8_PAROT|nr:unnamed protein product [Paramecium octaurelia]